MTKLIYTQQNGDTMMILFDNGTRILDNKKDTPFELEWPASVDLNISNYCEKGCSFCYQNCTRQGKNADLEEVKKILHPYMEVAININVGYKIDMQFIGFLEYCRDNHIIVNATINQDDLMHETRFEEIKRLQEYDLIKGLGVSMTSAEYMNLTCAFKNTVTHVIAGLISIDDLQSLVDYKHNVLILGYKQKGRAKNNDLPDMTELREWLKNNLHNSQSVLCFDNKAIEQLNIKELVDDKIWTECYQGDEGTISMYVNGVDMTFACNSFTDKHYNINGQNIQEMFDIVRKEKHNEECA